MILWQSSSVISISKGNFGNETRLKDPGGGAVGDLLDIPVYSDSYKEFDAAVISSVETPTLYEQYEDDGEIPIIHVLEIDPATVADQARLNPEQRVLLEVDYRYKSEPETQNGIFYHLRPSENTE